VTRILVVGGGHVGLTTALRLQRRLRPGDRAEVTVLEPKPYMTYQPFLAEAAAGSIDPRHVVVPLRRVLTGCRVVTGRLAGLDHDARRATVRAPAPVGPGTVEFTLDYDLLVLAPGAVSRILPVPGLAAHGIGFRTVEEAVALRNHVLSQLDLASSTRDAELRQAALTFVFVGGGYAGTGALGELEDMAGYALRHYPGLGPEDLRWVLVEAGARILPETDPDVGERTLADLRDRNIDVRLRTRLASVAPLDGAAAGGNGRAVGTFAVALDDGTRLTSRTLVWTAGVRPHPVLAATGFPLDPRGFLRCDETLRVQGAEDVWAAGDGAHVPDAARADGGYCVPNAQHAVHQAHVLADNILARLRGRPPRPYRYALLGSISPLGVHKGVAQLRGRALHGRWAWLLHRAVHLWRVPTFDRKARVLADWLLTGVLRREIVSLGSVESPRDGFLAAAGDAAFGPGDL